jgi:hypothetical protein
MVDQYHKTVHEVLMAKKMVVAVMLGVAFIGALYAVISFLKQNESVTFDSRYTWHAEHDADSGANMLVRGRKIQDIKKDINKLIMALNKSVEESETIRPRSDGLKYEFPKITLQKIDLRTAHIEIANDQYLTQRMGSSGAQDYLAEVTFTLTEDPDIKAVNFIFEAGEHAMPGIYSRESFTNYNIMAEGGRNR